MDLEEKNIASILAPFEVLSPGHISSHCKESIQNIHKVFNIRVKKSVYDNLAKTRPR